MQYKKFTKVTPTDYAGGWDRFALDYEKLPAENRVYRLTKKVIYEILDKNIEWETCKTVLDLGCGTGNDFAFFLERDAQVTGVDMSGGMLNKAFEAYNSEIESGKVTLLQGKLEEMESDAFGGRTFDLIFSMTGGFAYITNSQLDKVLTVLRNSLNPGGSIISAHFNRFCLTDTLYHLSRLRFRDAFKRWTRELAVDIKQEKMKMHLRSSAELLGLFKPHFKNVRLFPLLAFTPPFQTGYHPCGAILNMHHKLEKMTMDSALFARIADQIVVVASHE